MMIVATTAIDSEMIVVQMRGFVDHDDDDDDAGPSCAESISAVTGLGDLWVGMQPVPDRAIFS